MIVFNQFPQKISVYTFACQFRSSKTCKMFRQFSTVADFVEVVIHFIPSIVTSEPEICEIFCISSSVDDGFESLSNQNHHQNGKFCLCTQNFLCSISFKCDIISFKLLSNRKTIFRERGQMTASGSMIDRSQVVYYIFQYLYEFILNVIFFC